MSNLQQWTWNDGWILMATYLTHGNEGSLLHELLGAADAINHAIPTPKELSRAFTKMVSNGIMVITDGRFKLKKEFLPAIEKAYNGRGGLFDAAKKGEKWLKSLKLTPTNTMDIILGEAEVTEAYKKYIAGIKKSV